MTASRQMRKAWEQKFARLVPEAVNAQENVLVAIHEAREDGVSNAEIARLIGAKAASAIPAKASKGEAILERRRKRGPVTP